MSDTRAGKVDALARKAAREALRGRGDPHERREFTITKFERHEDGYLHARVTPSGGKPVYVHRMYGSWMAPGTHNGHAVMKDVLPHVAAELQLKARVLETRERRAEDKTDDVPEV